MKNYRKYITDRLWEDFQSLQNNPHTFKSFISYYNTLVMWVKDHLDIIDESLINNTRLGNLLMIDPAKYIVPRPWVSLDREPKRMFQYRHKTMNTLLMSISSTLWDMVTIYSDKDCPRCKNGGLTYVILEITKTKERKLALECNLSCGFVGNVDGTEWEEGNAVAYPVNKDDLRMF